MPAGNIFGANERYVANCIGYSSNLADSMRESEANAEFIVRACNAHDDLLSAAKEALPCVDEMFSIADLRGEAEAATKLYDLGDRLRAAIQKATT